MKWLLVVFITLCFPVAAQEQRFNLEKADQSTFREFLAQKKVIIIGEMHGTKEVPAFVLQVIRLMKENEKNLTVGFEIDRDMQPDMDAFMETGNLGKFIQHDYFKTQDGRTSEAMGDLFVALQKIPGIHMVCFDDHSPTTPFMRDSLMGINLAELFTCEKMVILTGNLHASLQKGFWKPNFKSATYYFKRIRNLGDELVSLNSYMGSGTFWNCTQEGCGEHPAYSDPGIEKKGLKQFVSINEDDAAYNGYVYFENVSASLPMRR